MAGARPGVVVLDSDEEIRTETLVWTAGTKPNPLLQALPIERDKRGAVPVDEHWPCRDTLGCGRWATAPP